MTTEQADRIATALEGIESSLEAIVEAITTSRTLKQQDGTTLAVSYGLAEIIEGGLEDLVSK